MDSDEELLAKIKAGQDILAEIVMDIKRRYGNDLLKFCGRILVTYPQHHLEDVVQEIFLAVYRNIHRFVMTRGAEGIRPWLYGIAHKKCVDELRKKENREVATSDFTELEPELSNPSVQEHEERRLRRILFKKAFAELSVEERLLIATRLMDWFSREEMAAMFGYDNPESYDQRLRRIYQKMRRVIEKGTP